MSGRRDGVIGRLRHIDVSIRMHLVAAFVAGENFVCEVSDHFIDVHINARVSAALPHIKRKFLFVAAFK